MYVISYLVPAVARAYRRLPRGPQPLGEGREGGRGGRVREGEKEGKGAHNTTHLDSEGLTQADS